MSQIAPIRIIRSDGFFIAGAFSLVGLLLLLGATGLVEAEALPVLSFLILLAKVSAAACFFIGFWVLLFRRIEQRLVDIQSALPATPQSNQGPRDN